MDIVKPKTSAKSKVKQLVTGLIILIIAVVLYQFSLPDSSQKVKRTELLIGTVKKGDMDVAVKGYGVLRSDKQKLLTSLSTATVEEIVLKPGATVAPDSIILRMSNPELMVELDLARQRESQEKANLRQLKLNNTRDLMAEDAVFAELTASYNATKMRRQAEEQLVEKGVVSALNYNQTRMEEQQFSARVAIQEKRRSQLLLVQEEAIKIQQEQINQAHSNYLTILNRVEKLTVTAGIDGVLQDLPVELGQSVAVGQALALVGSRDDLVALVQIPQIQAEKVSIGQKAIIDTRREQVAAKVTRISPAVSDGTVTVEIAFVDATPASARPELNVDGTIFTQKLNSVWYIERPVKAGENSKSALYRIDGERDEAIRQEVVFGAEAGRYIQIVQGAREGDSFILSDLNKFNDLEKLTIIQ